MSIYRNFLERRVRHLERLVYERSVGKGGGPSKAYMLWDYLLKNGPKTASQLQSTDLRSDVTSNAALRFFLNNNLITKNGNNYEANADYNWDDVGVIPRTALQEIQQELQSAPLDEPEAAEEPEDTAPSRNRSPRQRVVKANIFSRKLPEVKAAVEQGVDINSRDSYNRTPIVWAAMNKNNAEATEIVRYLLEHGANPNSRTLKKENIIITAIENGNYDLVNLLIDNGASVDTPSSKGRLPFSMVLDLDPGNTDLIAKLISNEAPNYYLREFLTMVAGKFYRGDISKEAYDTLINKIVDHKNFDPEHTLLDSSLAAELSKGVTSLFDAIVRRFNYFPVVSTSFILDEDLPLYYDTIKRYKNVKPSDKSYFIKVALNLAEKLKDDPSWIYDIITPEWIRECKNFQTISDIVRQAISRNDTKLLNTVNKAFSSNIRVDALGKEILEALVGLGDRASQEITRICCKILNKQLSSLNRVNSWYIERIGNGNNKYLIDYLIDRGFADYIISDTPPYRLSSTFKDAAKENGIDLDARTDINKSRNYEMALDDIILDIKRDDNFRNVESILRRYPEMLGDERLVAAINDPDNDESITARQLRRRLADYNANKPKDKYDM